MVGSSHLRTFVTAKVEYRVTLGCQMADGTLGDVVVYRIAAVLNVDEDVVPKLVEIVNGRHQIRSCHCRILFFLHLQVLSQTYEDFLGYQSQTCPAAFCICKTLPFIPLCKRPILTSPSFFLWENV